MTKDELLAVIEAAAKDLNDKETGFQPFTYNKSDVTVLPVFSSQQYAKEFIQVYVPRVNKIIPFQVLTVRGYHLVSSFVAVESVVLNDESKHQYELSSADIERIAKKCEIESDN
jgi:hypothetical protein